MSKTISLSARVDAELFEEFKKEYLKKLKESLNENTPSEIVESVLKVSNSELVSMAMEFGLKYLRENK